jgi:diacylglycerol O-acyltransferase / wax synthase
VRPAARPARAGPDAASAIAGSKITGFFAFAPTIGAPVNTALISYAGMCDIGVNIDTAAVPDPETLLGCLQESFAEITAMGATGTVPTG